MGKVVKYNTQNVLVVGGAWPVISDFMNVIIRYDDLDLRRRIDFFYLGNYDQHFRIDETYEPIVYFADGYVWKGLQLSELLSTYASRKGNEWQMQFRDYVDFRVGIVFYADGPLSAVIQAWISARYLCGFSSECEDADFVADWCNRSTKCRAGCQRKVLGLTFAGFRLKDRSLAGVRAVQIASNLSAGEAYEAEGLPRSEFWRRLLIPDDQLEVVTGGDAGRGEEYENGGLPRDILWRRLPIPGDRSEVGTGDDAGRGERRGDT
jgi:hypothetical protein